MAFTSWFLRVRAATTANVGLTGTGPIDGVTLANGDRVLAKDQTTASQNGIWEVAAGGWVRPADFSGAGTVTPEAVVRVSEGSINGHTEWTLTTTGAITVDTTQLSFAQSQRNAGVVVNLTAASAIVAGAACHTSNSGKVSAATTFLRTRPFLGIALTGAASNTNVTVQTNGPVSPSILSLGAGVACAVGVDASGVPVRATDPACASAPNWIGTCDSDGTIVVGPRRESVLNVLDFGATATGGGAETDDSAAFAAAFAACNSSPSGAVIFVPRGRYHINQSTHDLGALVSGSKIRGEGASGSATGSVLEFWGTGSGLWLWREYASNSVSMIEIEKLSIVNRNTANIGGTVSDGSHTFTIQRVDNTSPIKLILDTDHPWTTGQTVTVAGVLGCTAANGTHVATVAGGVTSTAKRTLTLNGTTGNGQFVSGGAGIEIGGGGEVWIRACQINGWQYGVIDDSCNGLHIRDCLFSGDLGALHCCYGVWGTNAGERVTSAGTWAVQDNTNLLFVDGCFFNEPIVAIKSSGGVNHHVTRSLVNLGTSGYAWDIEGSQQTEFSENYFEGNTDGSPVSGVIRIGDIFDHTFARNYGAIGGAAGAPLLIAIGNNNSGLSLLENHCTAGTSSAMITGASTMSSVIIGNNNLQNSHGAVAVFDGDVLNSSWLSGARTSEFSGREGVNTLKPQWGWDYRDNGAGWAISSPWVPRTPAARMLSHSYKNVSEATRLTRGVFSLGGSGSMNPGSVDGLAFLALAASASATPFPDTWDIAPYSVVVFDIDIIGSKTSDQTKYALFRKQVIVTRTASATPVISSTDDRDTPKNTDAFAAPAFGISGNALQVSVTGKSYATQWIVRVVGVAGST